MKQRTIPSERAISLLGQNRAKFTAIAALFVLTRFIYLDADLPPWSIGYYQSIDEFYYTIPAFNLFHHQSFQFSPFPLPKPDVIGVNFFQAVFTFISLEIFGNNYYGLRSASVGAGALILWLLYLAGKKAVAQSVVNHSCKLSDIHVKNLTVCGIVYLLCDFTFLMSNRIAEPGIFNILYVAIVFYSVLYIERSSGKKWAILGFIGAAGPLYVYPYVAYVFPALLATAAFSHLTVDESRSRKISIIMRARNVAMFLAGASVSFAAFYMLLNLVVGVSLSDYFSVLHSAGGSRVSPIKRFENPEFFSGIFELILSTNIFRFNPVLLLVFLGLLPLYLWTIRKKRDLIDIFLLSLIFFRFLQFLFAFDTPQRKLVDLLVIVFFLYVRSVPTLILFFRTESKAYKNLLLIAFFGTLMSAIWYFQSLQDAFNTNAVQHITKEVFSISFLSTVDFAFICVMGAVAAISVISSTRSKNVREITAWLLLVSALAPGLANSYKYIFADPTFKYRNAMIEIGEKINGKIVIGGMSFAMRLYNTSVPVLNAYMYPSEQDIVLFRSAVVTALKENMAIGVINYRSIEKDDAWSNLLILESVYDINNVQRDGSVLGFFVYREDRK